MSETWEELMRVPAAQEAMLALGDCAPTVNIRDRQVKGYVTDEDGGTCKVYYSAAELREIARGCDVVARWLEERAEPSLPSTQSETGGADE